MAFICVIMIFVPSTVLYFHHFSPSTCYCAVQVCLILLYKLLLIFNLSCSNCWPTSSLQSYDNAVLKTSSICHLALRTKLLNKSLTLPSSVWKHLLQYSDRFGDITEIIELLLTSNPSTYSVKHFYLLGSSCYNLEPTESNVILTLMPLLSGKTCCFDFPEEWLLLPCQRSGCPWHRDVHFIHFSLIIS